MSETGLRYLLEALNAGSMRAAADRLNVAPSSISRQITQLEEGLGLALIEKGRRGVKLTRAGEIVIDHYRNQLSDREALRAKLDDLRAVRSGYVVLAVGEGFLGTTFTDLVNSFNRENPQVRVDLLIGSSHEIMRMVMDDEAHLGLVFQTPQDMKIQARSSIDQPLMAIALPTHPIARLQRVSIEDLQKYPVCLAPKNFRLRQILNAAEARSGCYLEPAITTNSIFVMREAVRSGAAVAILPQLAVWSELQDGSLASVPIADDAMEHTTVSLILRSGRQLEGAPMRLMKMLEAQLRRWNTPLQRFGR